MRLAICSVWLVGCICVHVPPRPTREPPAMRVVSPPTELPTCKPKLRDRLKDLKDVDFPGPAGTTAVQDRP